MPCDSDLATPPESSVPTGGGFEFADDRFEKPLGRVAGEQDDQPRIGAELARAHQAAGGELAGDVVEPLFQRRRQE